MENSFGRRTVARARSIIFLQPEDRDDYGNAENGHPKTRRGEEIGACHQRNPAEQSDHLLLFPAVNCKPASDRSPNDGSDDGICTPNQIFRQVQRWHEKS